MTPATRPTLNDDCNTAHPPVGTRREYDSCSGLVKGAGLLRTTTLLICTFDMAHCYVNALWKYRSSNFLFMLSKNNTYHMRNMHRKITTNKFIILWKILKFSKNLTNPPGNIWKEHDEMYRICPRKPSDELHIDKNIKTFAGDWLVVRRSTRNWEKIVYFLNYCILPVQNRLQI